MMASLLHVGGDETGSGREAVRVSDPDSADVLFVPFFSSLSFNMHVRNMAEPDSVDEKLQVREFSPFLILGLQLFGNLLN